MFVFVNGLFSSLLDIVINRDRFLEGTRANYPMSWHCGDTRGHYFGVIPLVVVASYPGSFFHHERNSFVRNSKYLTQLFQIDVLIQLKNIQ